MPGRWPFHLLAVAVVLTWGVTFVNSKVLLNHGMQAHEIFFVRFLLAYASIWLISPRRLWADSVADELRLVVLGITGGSLYFIAENVAVKVGYVNNVSIIVCTAPLLTTLLALLIFKDVKASRQLVVGSMAATVGVSLVVFNGHIYLKINPLGDILAFSAALCWATYSLLLRRMSHYNVVFLTRKVFFYGLITVLPVFLVKPWSFPLHGFAHPVVAGNLLFLGLIASFTCFVLWSFVSKRLGALMASNYIYLNPISTMVASGIVLHEHMTWMASLGSLFILVGVFLANKGTPRG